MMQNPDGSWTPFPPGAWYCADCDNSHVGPCPTWQSRPEPRPWQRQVKNVFGRVVVALFARRGDRELMTRLGDLFAQDAPERGANPPGVAPRSPAVSIPPGDEPGTGTPERLGRPIPVRSVEALPPVSPADAPAGETGTQPAGRGDAEERTPPGR